MSEVPTYLQVYEAYSKKVTDAPEVFNEFAGMFSLSTSIARSMSIPFGSQEIYPNMWLFLLGSSGSRKTTAMNIAKEVVLMAGVCGYLPNEFSQEALIGELHKQPNSALWLSEMSNFMGVMRKKYNDGNLGALTDMYDVPEKYMRRTKGDGEMTLERPAVSVFACSTPNFMGVNKEEWSSGFGPRFLMVSSARSDFIPWPETKDFTTRAQLIAFLKNAARLQGKKVAINDDAKAKWCAWSTATDETVRQDEDAIQSFFNRLQVYSLKMAMIHRVSRMNLWTQEGLAAEDAQIQRDGERIMITVEDVRYGAARAKQVLSNYAKALHDAKFVGDQRYGSRLADLIESVRARLVRLGGHCRLMEISKDMLAKDRNEALRALQDDGVVGIYKEKKYQSPEGRWFHGATWVYLCPTAEQKGVDDIEAVVADIRSREKIKSKKT